MDEKESQSVRFQTFTRENWNEHMRVCGAVGTDVQVDVGVFARLHPRRLESDTLLWIVGRLAVYLL